jgi:membrane protease YdiL (CAAX protease family)
MTSTVFRKFKNTLGTEDFIEFVKKDWSKSYPFIFIFLAFAIATNYYFDLEDSYLDLHKNTIQGTFYFFILNACMYLIPLLLLYNNTYVSSAIRNVNFWLYIGIALLVLSLMQSTNLTTLVVSKWYDASYFNNKLAYKLNSIFKYIVAYLILAVFIGKMNYKGFGFFNFKFNYKTYLGFLLVMVPLLLFAATQPDFLKAYPKLKQYGVSFEEYVVQLSIYEPFYLLNFVMLEWFFRGYMVLFFKKYLNTKAIILVAMVYCSFHFGKPMLECISSFFGGYLLGYIVYKTKSIWGGVIVHMGIAFLMDLFAFLSKAI